MSPNKAHSLDSLIHSLLQECSVEWRESGGLEAEWTHYQLIHQLISLIQEKEAERDRSSAPTQSDPERRMEALPQLMTWLTSKGAKTGKVEVVGTGCGLGLRTLVPLEVSQEAFTIPHSAIITSSTARSSKLGILGEKDPILRSMENVLLALFLLYEKFIRKEESEWRAYIHTLPSSHDTVLFFSKEDMTLLRNSSHQGFREALKMIRNIARQYAYFHTLFRKGSDSGSRGLRTIFTINRYMWAVSTVLTRQNMLPCPTLDGGKEEMALVPFWDLCNHEQGILTTDFNRDLNSLVCYAGRPFQSGEEFKIYYGPRTSIEYFVHNAFVPPSPPGDTYKLELGIGTKDPNLERKVRILGLLDMSPKQIFQLRPDGLQAQKGLFVFIRLFQADNDLLDKIEEETDEMDFLTTPNEQVWEFLRNRFLILKGSAEKCLRLTETTLFGEKRRSQVTPDLSSPNSQTPGTVQILRNSEQMILQLIRNEVHLLGSLSESTQGHLEHLRRSIMN